MYLALLKMSATIAVDQMFDFNVLHQFHPTIPNEISYTRFESLPLLKADRIFFIVQHYLDKTSQLLKQNQIKTNVLKAAVSASICVLQHFNSTTIIKQKLNRSILLNLLQTLIITTLYMAERNTPWFKKKYGQPDDLYE